MRACTALSPHVSSDARVHSASWRGVQHTGVPGGPGVAPSVGYLHIKAERTLSRTSILETPLVVEPAGRQVYILEV